MKSNSIYIKIDEGQNLVHTSGVAFCDFVRGVGLSGSDIGFLDSGIEFHNRGMLIMAGSPDECHFNMRLLMEYVAPEQVEIFTKENVYRYGDFCWVDFQREDQLEAVTDEELAQLLYMSHMKKPLKDFRMKSLGNHFAYLCHDDGWWNNIFMADVNQYKAVIQYLLQKEIKGRKKTIAEPDAELTDRVFTLCRDGLVIDFERKTLDGVMLLPVGSMETMDDLERQLALRRKKNELQLRYDARKKVWSID